MGDGGAEIGKGFHPMTVKTRKPIGGWSKLSTPKAGVITQQSTIDIRDQVLSRHALPEFDADKGELAIEMLRNRKSMTRIKRATGWTTSELKAFLVMVMAGNRKDYV